MFLAYSDVYIIYIRSVYCNGHWTSCHMYSECLCLTASTSNHCQVWSNTLYVSSQCTSHQLLCLEAVAVQPGGASQEQLSSCLTMQTCECKTEQKSVVTLARATCGGHLCKRQHHIRCQCAPSYQTRGTLWYSCSHVDVWAQTTPKLMQCDLQKLLWISSC